MTSEQIMLIRPGPMGLWALLLCVCLSGCYAHLQPAWAGKPGEPGSIYFVSDRSARGSENIYAMQVPGHAAGSGEPDAPQAVFEAGVPVLP